MPVAGARNLKHIFRLSGHPIKGEARGKVENAMKATSFAIGVAAGALLGAAASVAAETYMPASVRRDLRRYTHKGMRAMGHIVEGVGTLMHG